MREAEELVTYTSSPPYRVQLTDKVRKLAVQILGLPPEYKETPIAEFLGLNRETKPEPQPAVPSKKSKRKKPTAPAVASAPSATPSPLPSQAATVPIMQQYWAAKERHPGMLLLFRMGDFYELFDADAELAAKVLGLTLTTRDKTTSMTGFPHHSLEVHLRKLLHAGHRVAICDQVPESLSEGPIRREVTRIVVPGATAQAAEERPD